MPRRLKNLDVSWISLVDKGANKKTVIYKGADTPGIQLKTGIPLFLENQEVVIT